MLSFVWYHGWKHGPAERFRVLELIVHNQPNTTFYYFGMDPVQDDQKTGMSVPPGFTGSMPRMVQGQEPFLSKLARPNLAAPGAGKGTLRRAIFMVGKWIRGMGQAMYRLGSTIHGSLLERALARLVGVRQRKPSGRGFDPRLAQEKNSLACPMPKALWSPV